MRGYEPLNHVLTSVLRATAKEGGRSSRFHGRYLPRMGLFETLLPDGNLLKMWSNADDEITSAVYWGGWAGHEPETSRCFWELATSARVTLDVGAHVGYFSLLAAFANPAGTVHAFEPLPAVHDRLRRNIALNGLVNISSHQLAVGGESGRDRFYYLPNCIPSSSSLSHSFMEDVADGRDLQSSVVEVTTIDEFVTKNDVRHVDLVKIDTESTEGAVLAGMIHTLDRDRPALVCEILPGGPAAAVDEVLRPLDYEYFLLTDTGPSPLPRLVPHPTWRNFLFRPRHPSSAAE